ncbi:DUF2029 domain-containing protein, partial [bacterium]|nr:DUF2029 domain-containing protein [bacterium]
VVIGGDNDRPRLPIWRPILAGLLMVLAFYTKQTTVLSAAGLGIWMLASRRFRQAGWYAGIGAALAGIIGAFLYLGTDGLWWVNNFGGLKSPVHFPALYENLRLLRPLDTVPFVGGLVACFFLSRGDWKAHPLKWAFVLSFLASELTVLRSGSNTYYYLEPYLWGTVLAAILLRRIRWGFLHEFRLGPIIWALLILLFLGGYGVRARRLVSERSDLANRGSWVSKHARAVEVLSRIQGPILTSEGYAWWHTQAPPTMMDSLVYSVRVEAGSLSEHDLVSKIARQEFEKVVLHWKAGDPPPTHQGIAVLPEAVVRAIQEQYAFGEYAEPYYFYEPGGASGQ